MKKITAATLQDLSSGSVFLATGGGGDPYVAYLATEQVLKKHGHANLISIDDLADDAFVVAIGSVGAPTVSLELMQSIDEPSKALKAYEKHIGRKIDAVVSFEIGGANSLIPIIAAAEQSIPIVDGDGMGRALPEAQMMTFSIGNIPSTPSLAIDYEGNEVIFNTSSTRTYERHIRSITQAMGGMVTTVEHPMTGRELKQAIIPDTVSFSIELGRVLRLHRGNAHAIITPLNRLFKQSLYGIFCHLFTGKIVDYTTSIIGGYDIGIVTIESFNGRGPQLTINIKNEYLVATIGEQIVASVPDLITVVDYETSTPINAERLRFGQRVTVFGTGCPDFYRQTQSLKVVEPRCFGFDFDFVPLENLIQYHQSID